MTDARPNILLIMTDQQSASAMSCAGNTFVRTPAMDSLAAGGTRFERAYSSNPICVPQRTSLFTGLMSHQTGVEFNDMTAAVHGTCIGRRLREAGYATGYIGKWHIPREITDREWSGFDYLAENRNNGVDALLPDHCRRFLDQKRTGPFFLVASFVNPHDICEVARIESGIPDRLRDGEIGLPPPLDQCPPLPDNFEPPANEPEAIRLHQSLSAQGRVYPTRAWDDGNWRRYRWAYYRLVEQVDRHIAEVLNCLRQRDLEKNTLVIFTSDHGDGMGAHRWNQKTIFYDEVSRVPFILRLPGVIPAGTVNKNILLNIGIDVATTLLHVAGAAVPSELKGQDVCACARGQTNHMHPFVVSQNYLFEAPATGQPIRGRMLRSDRFKYVVYDYGANCEQLFDLDLDPGETNNLAGNPAAAQTLQIHRELLRGWLVENDDPFKGKHQ